MNFGNNLKKIRQEKEMTQEELAKKINTSRSNIANYENDKNMPSIEILNNLSEALNCSTDFLLGKSDKRNNTSDIDASDKNFYMCPVYGKISAGIPNWAEECIEGRLPIDPELMGIINPEEHYFLKVNGESMNKIIKNGAYALIHKQDFVENGEIAVVLVNGYDATLKIFTKQDDVVVLSPNSTDTSFKQQIYTKETPIKVIGKYVGKMEFNN